MTIAPPQGAVATELADLMPAFDTAMIDQLLADLRTLDSRSYEEIGVPMFMVGEDLTPAATPQPQRSGGDADLAVLFARLAQALSAHRGDLDACDIGQLLELLADRHLLGFATPPFSATRALHPDPA